MFDILVLNGIIVDGSGRIAFQSDIGIIGEKIISIGNLKNSDSVQTIDAKGAYVCPGIIDVHTHSDMTMFYDGRLVSQLRQGVTTQIVGLCGYSLGPVNERSRSAVNAMSFFGCSPTWSSFASYLEEIEKLSLGTNIGSYVGHANLRLATMQNPIGCPTEEQLSQMMELLDDSLNDGAFGLTTGLEYNPGKASELSELEKLCSVVSKHGALHCAHTRNRDKYYLSAINEVIDISRATGVRLQISHINPKYGCYKNTMQDLISTMKEARKQGIHVVADVMPSEYNHSYAIALLPLWAQNLSPEDLTSALQSEEGRVKLKDNPSPLWQLAAQDKWDRIYHFGGTKTKEFCGDSIADIAKQKNMNGFDTVCSLLAAEAPNFSSLIFTSNAFSLDDIALAIQDEGSSVVSDVVGLSKDGYFKDTIFSPNTYDWFAVFMRNFASGDKPVFTLEQAIQKVSSIPAWQVGIKNRGLLYQGYQADIMIFNPEKLKTTATLKNPCEHPEGMQTVIVNGKLAYEHGKDSVNCHGQVLRFNQASSC